MTATITNRTPNEIELELAGDPLRDKDQVYVRDRHLEESPYQTRNFSDEDITSLVESIKERGVLQAIPVYEVYTHNEDAPDGKDLPVRYVMAGGSRRRRSNQIVNGESNSLSIPVRILESVSEEEFGTEEIQRRLFVDTLSENQQRKDLTYIELAESIHTASTDFEMTHNEIARSLLGQTNSESDAGRQKVLRYLKVHTLTDEAKAVINENLKSDNDYRISQTAAIVIAEQVAPEEQPEAIQYAIEKKATVKDLEAKFKDSEKDESEKQSAPDEDAGERKKRDQFLSKTFTNRLGFSSKIKTKPDGKVVCSIELQSNEEMESLMSRLEPAG